MQPYLFPYFPYLQLLAGVDVFIIFDTSQFIARGWANRNAIRLDGGRHAFVLPVRKHARDTAFSDIHFADNFDGDLARFRTTLDRATRSAPFRDTSQHLIDATFPNVANAGTPMVDAFERMAVALMEIIGFQTHIVRASQLQARAGESAQDYIVSLVKNVEGIHYINPIGGTALYNRAAFASEGLYLSFLQTRQGRSRAGDTGFDGSFSILDCVARHSTAELHDRLRDFVLIDGPDEPHGRP
jgi:hypothetical protein